MATLNVSVTGGVTVHLEHSEVANVASDATKIGPTILGILGPALAIAGVAAPIVALIGGVVTAYFTAQIVLITRIDRGYGVNLTLPWPAIFFQQWWLIIPLPVPPPGIGVCPAGGQHNYLNSSDYALVMDQPAAPGQHDWRWCGKCKSLNWGTGGVCPAGGQHDRQSSDYALVMDQPAAPGQHDWRWCDKCHGLSWGMGPDDVGVCPGGGKHRRQSSDYALPMDQPTAPGQHNWRWCEKCSGLFWAGLEAT